MSRDLTGFTDYSPQEVANREHDAPLHLKRVMPYGQSGPSSATGLRSDMMATKVTVSGSITYVGYAAPGSAQSSAVWQAFKVDETTGTVVTWADGNANFDNVATDLTALTYS